jgi:hypothetical protein
VKWSQLPELIQPVTGGAPVWYGVDRLSSHVLGVVMADDFISDGRPIAAVRWWGSYLLAGPAPYEPPPGFTVPFEISFHLSTGTHPNSLPVAQPMTMYLVMAQEHYTGFVDQAGHPVYEYNAYLDPWFPEVAGQEYFIDICRPEDLQWGWHDAGPAGFGHPIMDWAAVSQTHVGPWATFVPNTDLAFELMTDIPEPATWLLVGAGLLCATLVRRRR